MSGFRRLMRDSDYSGPGSSDYADRWDEVFGLKRRGLDYLATQCPQEVKIERMPASTFHCTLRVWHDGPCVISVLGSDALHEAPSGTD